jgi:hypothetical protein
MKIKLMLAWYDAWVGFFWDAKKRYLYFFPIPMVGVRFAFYFKCIKCGKKLAAGDVCYYCGRPHCYECKKNEDWVDDNCA